MSKVTVATVNKELKRLGFMERLSKGNGYFYFSEGDSYLWKEDSVYVYQASELTLEQWMNEYYRLKNGA